MSEPTAPDGDRPSTIDRARRLVPRPRPTGSAGPTEADPAPPDDAAAESAPADGAGSAAADDGTDPASPADDPDAVRPADDPDAADPPDDPTPAPSTPSTSRGQGLTTATRRPRPRPAAAAIMLAPPVTATEEPSAATQVAATDEGARRSRAGRNLPAAIGVGVGLGAIIIASLFAYRPSFAVIVGIAALYGLYELGSALRSARIRISLAPLLVGGAAMLVAAWLRGTDGLAVAGLVTAAAVLVWRIADGAHGYTRDAVASVFALLYVPLLAGFAVMLAHPHDGAGRVLVFIATVVCSDTGGYATGVLVGRHPLAPVVSKAKTWEGFAGSAAACSAAGVLFFVFTFHQDWWKGLLYGLAVVVTATLGDLGESMIKRDLDIKDMGRLLPGHGGVMDRLDSLLPCAAVAYLFITHFVPV